MSLLGGIISISNLSTLLFVVFAVLAFGYLLGRITVKGISLGDAGVFIIALVVGALFFGVNEGGELLFDFSSKPYDFNSGLSLVESLGLVLFVTSVGFIAGPKFFGNFKRNFKSYVLLGVIIILAGGLAAAGCIGLGEVIGYGGSITDQDGFVAMIVGLLSGSLTSTPAFSAAKATVAPEFQSLVSVGHGIAYIFGVIGVVLFVQIMPRILKADMAHERTLIGGATEEAVQVKKEKKLFELDEFGFGAFGLTIVTGVLLGSIKIPLSGEGFSGPCFSLGLTGGPLLMGLILAHFGRIGSMSLKIDANALKSFREFGLMLFLVGAGVEGGVELVEQIAASEYGIMIVVYGFIAGAVMTLIPMIVGYLFARKICKLPLLNNLGSITGGMTSTPALGTLIGVAGTDDVAAAYAATYPIALVLIVLASQLINSLMLV